MGSSLTHTLADGTPPQLCRVRFSGGPRHAVPQPLAHVPAAELYRTHHAQGCRLGSAGVGEAARGRAGPFPEEAKGLGQACAAGFVPPSTAGSVLTSELRLRLSALTCERSHTSLDVRAPRDPASQDRAGVLGGPSEPLLRLLALPKASLAESLIH